MGHLLRSISEQERPRLLSILEKHREEKTPQEVEWVIERMDQCGSIRYAQELARAFKEEAAAMFRDLTFLSRQPARDRLETLMNLVLERDH